MPSFEDLLKASLVGPSDRFAAADADLHAEVAGAAQGVEHLTEGRMTLSLAQVGEESWAVVYSLLLDKPGSSREVLAFRLGPDSYPILAARCSDELRLDAPREGWRTLNDREQLSNLFSELASDPGSPLVVAMAFFLRRARTEKPADG